LQLFAEIYFDCAKPNETHTSRTVESIYLIKNNHLTDIQQ